MIQGATSGKNRKAIADNKIQMAEMRSNISLVLLMIICYSIDNKNIFVFLFHEIILTGKLLKIILI